MKPGIHPDISIEEYHSGPGVSRSTLARLGTGSPLACHHARTHPPKPTPAMRLGSAIHVAVLEPELFRTQYAEMPKFDRRRKADKEAAAAWEEANADKIGLTPDEYATCAKAAAIVRSKKGPATALREGRAEQSIYWNDPGTGELVKARPDFLDLERALAVDLKTTSKGLDDRSIANTLEDHTAAVQAAMVNEGVMRVTGKPLEACYLLVLYVGEPMDLRLVLVNEDWLCRGERLFHDWLSTYSECQQRDDWPGWAAVGVTDVPMPVWLKKQEETDDV